MHFLTIFDSFDGENLLQIVILAALERLHFDFKLEQVKLFPLAFPEVVKKLDEDGELLVGGGEDRVLAEVDFIFIQFKALAGIEDGEGFGWIFLLAFFFHNNYICLNMSAALDANRKKLEEYLSG